MDKGLAVLLSYALDISFEYFAGYNLSAGQIPLCYLKLCCM